MKLFDLVRGVRSAKAAGVAVRSAGERGRGVFTTRAFKAGERVVRGRAVAEAPERTRHTLQMAMDRHVLFDEPACLINHSCGPNTFVRNNAEDGYDFIALRDIAAGDEVSFDYATTEYESIAVLECLCGAEECRGRSGGFVTLKSDHPLVASGRIADYLKKI